MGSLLYFDCFSGAAGDMIAGALLALGIPLEDLARDLAGLDLAGYRMHAPLVLRGPIQAVKFRVEIAGGQPERDHREIQDILGRSRLPTGVAEAASAVFQRLAQAEARVHGVAVDHVHFHEIGAVDSIVDIVAAAALLARFSWPEVHVSALPMGRGSVKTEHGAIPIPAPATSYLASGLAVEPSDEPFEQVTPTGAAILSHFAGNSSGRMPRMTVKGVGYGAGDRDLGRLPNVLCAWLGERPAGPETIWMVEAHVDDLTGELAGALRDALADAGAIDVFMTGIQMKKGRPGILVSALADAGALERVTGAFFGASTTFGVRRHPVERFELARDWMAVPTPFGDVRVKVGRWRGEVASASPEYEDCARLARERGVAVRDVFLAAQAAWSSGKIAPRQ